MGRINVYQCMSTANMHCGLGSTEGKPPPENTIDTGHGHRQTRQKETHTFAASDKPHPGDPLSCCTQTQREGGPNINFSNNSTNEMLPSVQNPGKTHLTMQADCLTFNFLSAPDLHCRPWDCIPITRNRTAVSQWTHEWQRAIVTTIPKRPGCAPPPPPTVPRQPTLE